VANASLADLKAKAKEVRRQIILSTTKAASGHPTSSLSGVEVAVALYFGGFMRYDPKNPHWPQRDRFILSKGHAAPLLYACLADAGYFSKDMLLTLREIGSPLEGHPNMRRLAGVEASTGSLGQGLSLGLGHALATKLDGFDSHIYVMMGDGELAEGQVWEAAMAASKYKTSNLTAIVDHNGYQQTGSVYDVLDLRPYAPRFEAMGWHTQEIDGHNQQQVLDALSVARKVTDRPTAIIAKTIKGYPIQGLLSDPNHHGKPLSKEEADKAIKFIDSQ